MNKKKIFLIAEIGINHNGDLNIAKNLIKESKSSGFDAVKFQKRDIEKVYEKDLLDSFRESPWGKTQRDQKKGLEFDSKEYDEINKYCANLKIDWFASPWDLNSLVFLDRYKCKFNKVASAMIVDSELLLEIAKRRKHTFISTGMSKIEHIDNAVDIFKKEKCSFELMHCVSTYPMKIEDANLVTIKFLKDKYKCNVGYSGHEIGLAVSYAAAGQGITSLERHITLDRAMYGSDQAASLEKSGMYELVKNVRAIEKSIGENKLGQIHPDEIKISDKLRAHIKRYQGLK
jgi:N-acetylneuraminate synthase